MTIFGTSLFIMTMENTSTEKIISIVNAQKAYFKSGATLDISFRKEMLRKLYDAINRWESRICDALWTDLHKSYEEAYLTELSIVTGEIRNHIRNVSSWAKRERRRSPLKLFPSRSYVVKEPLGNTLIVSPWNYPVQLLLNPLVGAISAGCTAVLKPSPYVPNVSSSSIPLAVVFNCAKILFAVSGINGARRLVPMQMLSIKL